jgi:hypothetical protein
MTKLRIEAILTPVTLAMDKSQYCEICQIIGHKGVLTEVSHFICDQCLEDITNALCAAKKEIEEGETE